MPARIFIGSNLLYFYIKLQLIFNESATMMSSLNLDKLAGLSDKSVGTKKKTP